MSGFNDISRMKLADLDRPDNLKDVIEDDELDMQEQENTEEVKAEPVESAKKQEESQFPIGQHYRVDSRMTAAILREFMFRHSYSQPMMILITILGIGMGGYGIYGIIVPQKNAGLFLMLALFIVVGYPLSYLTKANSIMKRNPAFQNEFHYLFDEWGVHLRNGGQDVDVQWRYVTKLAKYGKIAVVYTGKSNGYLIPYADLGDRKEEVLAFIEKMRAGNGR